MHFEHLDSMACWKPTLQEHLVSGISGISKPRYFKVQRDEDGIVRHQYRQQLQPSRTSTDMDVNRNQGCSDLAVHLGDFEEVLPDVARETMEWMPPNRRGYVSFNLLWSPTLYLFFVMMCHCIYYGMFCSMFRAQQLLFVVHEYCHSKSIIIDSLFVDNVLI